MAVLSWSQKAKPKIIIKKNKKEDKRKGAHEVWQKAGKRGETRGEKIGNKYEILK